MAATQYTRCVEPADYRNPNFTAEEIAAVIAIAAALTTGGASLVALGPIAFAAMRKTLEYFLYGKLVCLGGDRCAIGHVAEIEPVGWNRNVVESVDDDFSINLVLYPDGPSDFDIPFPNPGDQPALFNVALRKNLATARDNVLQGKLLEEPSGLAEGPREKDHDSTNFGIYHGYFVKFRGPDYGLRFIGDGPEQLHIPFPNPTHDFWVPIFHAEVEGARPYALLEALNAVAPPAVCDIPIIGPVGCAILDFILAPFVLAGLVTAWFAAPQGDPANAGDGTITVGDLLVVHGRWVYDAGHDGFNELHGVSTIQQIPKDAEGPDDLTGFYQHWCHLTGEAPPGPAKPGQKPAGMNARQAAIWDAQQQPENDWELHPAIDGCAPATEETGPPK